MSHFLCFLIHTLISFYACVTQHPSQCELDATVSVLDGLQLVECVVCKIMAQCIAGYQLQVNMG